MCQRAGIAPGSSEVTIAAQSPKSIAADELARLISPDRLRPYGRATASPDDAVNLYEWNMAISAAMFETVGAVEVILRNAFDRELRRRDVDRGGTGSWYTAGWLDEKGARDVATARDRATKHGHAHELSGKVVAELSFGFWRFLVAKRYQTTAWPALQKAFPLHPQGPGAPRVEVDDRVQRIHVLRNRIAHHEPIFLRNLQRDHDDLLALVGWMSVDAHSWVAGRSRVPAVLVLRPEGTVTAR